ncbi:MAG: PHP domain-containing protein [Clostridia bacterium]|nr:PHP domain-containing protein [Clostridia bacterium]
MNRLYYDFHIHSCLSPCADNDMTPNNIAGMAMLAGLAIAALTDHNSAKNCPAFFSAARRVGIIPIAGMELTTAEDIHMVCLFETLEGATAFDNYLEGHRMLIPNRSDIFGDQLICDENDGVTGEVPWYLHPASDIMIDAAPALIGQYGGVAYPAHVDREANGVIATLGAFPELPGCMNAEFYDGTKEQAYLERYPELKTKRILVSSDAHNLWSIRDKCAFLETDSSPASPQETVREVFRILRRAKT